MTPITSPKRLKTSTNSCCNSAELDTISLVVFIPFDSYKAYECRKGQGRYNGRWKDKGLDPQVWHDNLLKWMRQCDKPTVDLCHVGVYERGGFSSFGQHYWWTKRHKLRGKLHDRLHWGSRRRERGTNLHWQCCKHDCSGRLVGSLISTCLFSRVCCTCFRTFIGKLGEAKMDKEYD